MAKYNVTYACGHSDTIQLYGKCRDREWKLSREEEKLCPDCYRAKIEADRQKQNAEAAEANQAAGLPTLEGTEKQIAWAETLRNNFLNHAKERIDYWTKCIETGKDDENCVIDIRRLERIRSSLEKYRLGYTLIMQHTAASWWIDNRFMDIEALIIIDIDNAKKSASEPPKQIIEEAQAEATIYPEKAVTGLIAEISIKGNVLEATYLEKDESFREIVKNHGFEWKPGWMRTIGKFNGSIQDRAAEIGNKLLAAGFPIRIYDEEIRRRAVTGEYQPEPKWWIKARVEGDYKGWLSISWPREEKNYYDAARKLPGSKYKRPNVLVPPESFQEVLDFATMYKFNISDKAREIIETARQLREKSLTIGVKVPKFERSPKPGDVPDKLEVPEEVEIQDEFKEDV
jgi:hypothetical protein